MDPTALFYLQHIAPVLEARRRMETALQTLRTLSALNDVVALERTLAPLAFARQVAPPPEAASLLVQSAPFYQAGYVFAQGALAAIADATDPPSLTDGMRDLVS